MSTENRDLLDVDARFLLANERTLLAWLRTALTVLAGGVALLQVTLNHLVLAMVGLGLLTLGGTTAIVGHRRFRAADRAIRAGELPPPGRGALLLTGAVVLVATVLAAVYLRQLL